MARTISLTTRFVVAQVLLAATVVVVAVTGFLQVRNVENRLQRITDERIAPLAALGDAASLYSVDFVDAVHKVADGSISMDDGLQVIARVDSRTRDAMQLATAKLDELARQRILTTLEPLFAQARVTQMEAATLMRARDRAGLHAWRVKSLYGRVDPLTARIRQLVASDQAKAERELTDLQTTLHETSVRATVILAVTALLAVLVSFGVALRYVYALKRVSTVVDAAANGDLRQRIRLTGRDELATMAANVDAMIDAIEAAELAHAANETRLARSEAEARAATEAKSTFLSSMSHELRTPLNVILGYGELLQHDATLNSAQQRAIRRMHEAGEYLLQLIDDVLGLARMEANVLQLSSVSFDPAALLGEVERMLAPRADIKGLAFVTRVEGPLPPAVHQDPRRVQQILLNLISNAIKFTGHGTVTATMRWLDEQLVVRVEDTGPGISLKEQEQLFGSFVQGAAGQSTSEGAGLGLHISRQLARAMGGDVVVASTFGEGAQFTATVDAPASTEAPRIAGDRPPRRAVAGHGLAPMLVVDDRVSNRDVLCALLQRAGFEVLQAEHGAQALEMLAAHRVSFVWMDLKMPVLDGFHAIARIRLEERAAGRPRMAVVAITASVIELDAAGAKAIGFDGLIGKPFHIDDVLDIVEQLTGVVFISDAITSEPAHAALALEAVDTAALHRLVELLVAGDVFGASTLVRTLGPAVKALQSDIDSFQADRALAIVRAHLATRTES